MRFSTKPGTAGAARSDVVEREQASDPHAIGDDLAFALCVLATGGVVALISLLIIGLLAVLS